VSGVGSGKEGFDTHLEYMSPILALVIEPFVQHLHNLDEITSVQLS
jgi:hypothetical protein